MFKTLWVVILLYVSCNTYAVNSFQNLSLNDNAPVLYVEITTEALNQVKALYGNSYKYTNFDLQVGVPFHSPHPYTMFGIDTNPETGPLVDQFIAVDNNKLPTKKYDYIYPTLAVSATARGVSWLLCEDESYRELMLNPLALQPGKSKSTYLTYTGARTKFIPPDNVIYVMSCNCDGPACYWIDQLHYKQF